MNDDDIDFEIDKEICADDQRVADIIVSSSLVANSARSQGNNGCYNVPCLLVPPPEQGSYWLELLKKRYRSIGWLLLQQKEDRFFLAPLYHHE
jgi:hypothetical protein